MSIKPVILQEEIGKIPLFQGVAQSDLEQLVQAAHRKQYQAGEFFFLQDDPVERMYVLLDGRVSSARLKGEQNVSNKHVRGHAGRDNHNVRFE